MAVFIIGDLHLSLGCEKPMDVFQGWQDYVPRLEKNWRALVAPQDTVVLAGDTSWGMKLEESLEDFRFLEALPGRKVLLKGNHDYWWTTRAKMDRYLEQQGFSSLHILHNDSYSVEGLAVCGTRGWLFDQSEPQDEKVMARELGRLRASLQAAGEGEKAVFLHYPPVYPGARAEGVLAVLREFGVQRCFYGHLHGGMIRYAVQGEQEGVRYRLVSADALGFCPYKIS